ncbi:MAG: hypothetical protein M3178_14365 [Pseudomonadota bacterium]|nr:hypothetical protein [Pseudomonadota bacterium]
MRALLVGMSNMLFQIVTGVLATLPESVVVGRVADPANVAAEVGSTNVDVVVIQVGAQQNVDDVWPLLHRFRTLKVVTIAGTVAAASCMSCC